MRSVYLLIIFATLFAVRGDLKEAEEAAKKFELSSGFNIEAIAAEPQLQNPVAFSIDEKGRIYVAETHRLDNAVVDITKNTNWIKDDLSFRHVFERAKFLTNAFGTNAPTLTQKSEVLRLLEDTNGDGLIDQSKIARAGFKKVESGLAAGVLARGNTVWFACIPDLWRFENAERGPDATVRALSSGYGVHIGVTGHDLHGLAIGMDGKLYFSVGDRGFNVKTPSGQLSHPDTGGVLRCNLDGSELEVVAIGLRNPQELAFDELGNLWTADNDTAGEDKCRLIHVVEGTDYGWRASYQHMKGFGPWVQEKLWEGKLDGTLPSAGEPGHGPSGLAYNPGTGLPAEFAGHFLMCDFPGGIQSISIEPKGASYIIKEKKRFLWNAWPTDIEFGPDGALYFSDWVGGWTLPNKGRIYRLTHPEVLNDPKTAATAAAIKSGFDNKDISHLINLLEHHDLRVRQNAHLALGKRRDAANALSEVATNSAKPRAAKLHAIWALRIQGPIAADTLTRLLSDTDAEVRAQAIASASLSQVTQALKDESPRVRFQAANAMAKKVLLDTGGSSATDAIIDYLDKNADADPFLTHAGVRVLAYSQPALQRARKHSSVAVRRAAMLAERTLNLPSVANYLTDAPLAYEAARAVNDLPITRGFPDLAAMLTNSCPPEILSRAINANYRIGGPIAARRLASFATMTNVPTTARVDALQCLASWQHPDELDRVVGLWRPIAADIETRADSIAATALEPRIAALLQDTDSAVVNAALNCARDLALSAQASNVLAVFNAANRPAEVRAAALETLGEFGDTNFVRAIEGALLDKSLRIVALKLIQTNASAGTIARVIELLEDSDLKTAQAAFGVINRLRPSEATDALTRMIGKLANKQVPPELALDLFETAGSYPNLKNRVDASARQAFSDPTTELLLVGGNASEGRKIFEEKSSVACARCHVVKGAGGTVGPALDKIGSTQTREQLLDSILFPNKAIAPGYENVVITLQNGSKVAGLVVSETGARLEINSPEDGQVSVRKDQIHSTAKGLSAMPEGLGQLMTPFEIRDLVEYLASLKN